MKDKEKLNNVMKEIKKTFLEYFNTDITNYTINDDNTIDYNFIIKSPKRIIKGEHSLDGNKIIELNMSGKRLARSLMIGIYEGLLEQGLKLDELNFKYLDVEKED